MKDMQLDQMDAAAEEAAQFLKTLSNPGRLRLLCALVPGEMTVGELEQTLGASQSYVSGQLMKLREQGFVSCSKSGRVVAYKIADDRVQRVLERLYEVFCPDVS